MSADSENLLPRLIDYLDLRWMQSSHHLRNVCQFKVKEIVFDKGLG